MTAIEKLKAATSFEEAIEAADALVLDAAPDWFGAVEDVEVHGNRIVYFYTLGECELNLTTGELAIRPAVANPQTDQVKEINL